MLYAAEYVLPGHPDKLCDAIADALVEEAARREKRALCGIEVAVHRSSVFVTGRIACRGAGRIPVKDIVRECYRAAGYGTDWRPSPEDRPMEWFVDMLSNQLQSPVHDATGLTAKYDFVFSWSWEENMPGARASSSADIVSQLPTQLGLKLQRKKGPVEVLVVDHMEKVPTDN